MRLNAKPPGASGRKHTRKPIIPRRRSEPIHCKTLRDNWDALDYSTQPRAANRCKFGRCPSRSTSAAQAGAAAALQNARVDAKRKEMDSFLSSLQTLQKKPKTTTTNALDVFGTGRSTPKTTKTIAPDDYAPPKTSAPIFGAWPILPGAPTIPTRARAPPKRPREERPPRPPRAHHYGGGRGRGGGGKGRGRGGKGSKGKGRGKGRGRGGKGRPRPRR